MVVGFYRNGNISNIGNTGNISYIGNIGNTGNISYIVSHQS